MSQVPALVVQDLTKVFPSKPPFTAVDHLSFTLREGEILGLLGPNGAGKTTTIQMLLSTLKPTSGDITYFGKNLQEHRSEVLQHVAFASTYVRLPWRLTIKENLNVYGMLYGVSQNDRNTRMEKFLKFFGVWDQRNKEMSQLSAGQTTRVMLAKAFLAYPKIALLDEPTASLDPDIAHEVRAFVLEQRKEYGVSILFTSHNMDEVSEVCDRVMFLKKGKIIADDTPKKLAASVSLARVHLEVGDGLKRTEELAKKLNLNHTTTNREIEIEVDEHKIAELLTALAKANVEYHRINISHPTLEDYFLQAAGMQKKLVKETDNAK